MRDAGFDVSFWDCHAKGGMGGHPSVNVGVRPFNDIYDSIWRVGW
jgi:hypothetical protein